MKFSSDMYIQSEAGRKKGHDCTQKNHFYRSVSALFIQNKANPPIPMRMRKLTEQRWFSDSSVAFAHSICFDDLRSLFRARATLLASLRNGAKHKQQILLLVHL